MLSFRLLGELSVERDGRALAIGGKRPRALLAALLVRANSPADTGYLAEAVWETPPSAPESNLRTYVALLRRALEASGEAAPRLITCPGGYRLTVRPGELDVGEFHRLAACGDQAMRAREFAAAAGHFAAAARLWRGRPFAGLVTGPALGAEAAQLADLRISVAERNADAHLELGSPEAVVAELRALATEYSFREELRAQLMRVLHRCGRSAEALACFAETRQQLVTELGVEPGTALRQAQREILDGVPDTAPDTGRSAEIGAWRQLPMDIAEFTGRSAELAALLASAGPARGTPTAVAIHAIEGMAGVGKTRLAVHLAHRLAGQGRFDEIQLWTDLRGFDPASPPAEPAAVLAKFLRLLGVAGDDVPGDLDSRAALYRDHLAGRRALVLLDNAADEDQVRPLLPGTAGSLVLITSRRTLSELDGVRPVALGVLPEADAIALLARVAGDDRVRAEPGAAADIVERCGGLPIALSHAARRLRSRPAWTVRDLADRLGHASFGRHAVHTLFDLSYLALSPERRRLFRLLGIHPGDDVTAESVAALTGSTPDDAHQALEELLDEHLVGQAVAGRYRLHDLIRRYARDRAGSDETPATRRAALHRLLAWYLHAAEAARIRIDPNRIRIFPFFPPPAGCVVPEPDGYDAAMAWFEANRAGLRAAVRTAAECGVPAVAWQLPWVLLSFYYRSSHWDDWLATYRIGLAAARSSGELRGEGIIWRGLGVAYSDLRQYPAAIDCHERAQAILEEVGDHHGQAWNLNNLGVIHVDLGALTAAADCFGRALPLFRKSADLHGEGLCLNNLGDTLRRRGDRIQAVALLELAREIQHRMADRASLRFTLTCLGDLHHDAGRHEAALVHYREAAAISETLGDRRTLARALANVARTLDTLGSCAAAQKNWRRALTIFERLGDAQAATIRPRLLPSAAAGELRGELHPRTSGW